MRTHNIKHNLVSHTPFFEREHFAWELRHMMRDSTFWAIVVLAVIVAGLTLLAGYELWTGQSIEAVEPIREIPMWPYY